MTAPGDRARVSTFVDVSPQDAFTVFTEETNLWWKRGVKFRATRDPDSVVRFDGQRLVEVSNGGATERAFGRVLVWEPGARLVFEWYGANFQPGEKTQVEVLFEAENGGTRVTVTHSGFSSLRPGHPVRHGAAPTEFAESVGLWWGELAVSLRTLAHARRDVRPP